VPAKVMIPGEAVSYVHRFRDHGPLLPGRGIPFGVAWRVARGLSLADIRIATNAFEVRARACDLLAVRRRGCGGLRMRSPAGCVEELSSKGRGHIVIGAGPARS